MSVKSFKGKNDIFLVPLGKSRKFKEAFGSENLIDKFNKPILKNIIYNWDDNKNNIKIDDDENGEKSQYDPLIIIESYYNKSKNNDYNITKYKKCCNSFNYGRWFADKSLSIQNMPRAIRHSISKDIWIDLDFVNCHPVILEHLCDFYNINCHYLSIYNKNRQLFLNEIILKMWMFS